mgnify:CR=1 FL=1
MSKRNILLSIIAVVTVLLLGSTNAWSATITTAASGNWSSTSTWTGGAVPTATDDISIGAHTITIDQNVTINNITFTGAGAIQPASTGTYTITVTGNVDLTNLGDIVYSNGTGRLNIVFAGTAAQTVTLVEAADGTNGFNVNDLTFNNGTSVTFLGNFGQYVYGDLTLVGNATVTVGAYNAGKTLTVHGINSTITVPTTASLTLSNVQIANTATNVTMTGSATVSGTFTVAAGGKFDQTSGTITMNQDIAAGAAIIVNTGQTDVAGAEYLKFYNLTIDDGAAITLGTSFTVKGNLTWDMTTAANTMTNGYIVFKNTATPNNPKTINLTGNDASDYFNNILIDDGSYVTTASSFIIAGTTNAFEVVGSGSFKATAGNITFSGATANITTSSLSTCEFFDLQFDATATAATTSSDFTILGDLIDVGSGVFTASAPSTITFKNIANRNITSAGADNSFTFNNIKVFNGSSITTSGAFDVVITGNIEVENGATADLSTDAIVLSGTTQIVNNGTLTFGDITLSGNVTTESDFNVTGTLSIAGSIIASGNSTITFGGITPFATATANNCKLQNVKFTAAAAFAANSFAVKGDFYSSNNTTQSSGASVTFNGTSQQKILSDGSSTIILGTLILDNPQGLKLFENITLNTTGAATITFTNGNIDLNGSYTITMSGAAPQISGETYDRTFINTGIGAGTITTLAIPFGNAVLAGLGVSSTTGPSGNLTIARYIDSKIINGVPTVKRYYSILSSADDITGATVAYFNNQLNGNTDSKLWAYATSSATASTIATTDPPTTDWLQTGSVVTTGTNGGTIAITTNGLTAGNTYYIAFRNREVELEVWPTTGVHNDLAVEAMPLVAGSTSLTGTVGTHIVLNRFAIAPYFTLASALTQIKATLNQSVSGILSNFRLIEATNLTTPTVALVSTGTVSGNTVTFAIAGGDQDLTALTTRYFYIIADVSNSVNSSTQNITLTVAPSDITIANCDITGSAQSSPTISFTGQNVSVNVNNTPLSKPIMQSANDQVIFGFTLVPPTGTPNVTVSSIKLKANLTDGAITNHFTNFELRLDNNQDGIDDANLGGMSATNMNSGGYINFTGLNQTFSDKLYVLVRCDVAAGATIGGKIQLVIESSTDITVTSPALVVNGGPYEGGTFTVSDPAAVPTKLAVTSFGPATIPTSDDPEKKDREVLSGSNIVIQIQSQDANGNPANVTSNTDVSVTVTSGTATVGNGTGTIAINTNILTINNLTLTNTLGYGPITITATPTSGMNTLTPATYTNILIYATQPAATVTAFTATANTPSTATLDVTGSTNSIVIVGKEGSWPTAPSDGIVYDQVPGNNFTATNGSGNYFTGTGSVVVVKAIATNPVSYVISGLTPGKTYYFAVYEYNGGATANSKPNYQLIYAANNNKASVDMPSAVPTLATSAVTFGQVTTSSIKLNWTNGNGEKRIVIARAGGAPTPVIADGSVYTANSAYGDPTTANEDGFVVYNGNSNTVTVTNLLPGTTYHFAVYEYNGSGVYTNYIATAATGNRATLAAEPTIQAHSIDITPVSDVSLKVTWVNGNGSGRVLLGKEDNPISNADFPLDQGAALTGNAAFGSGTASGDAYVLGTSSAVTVTGLQFGKTYYFRVFEYNGTAGASATSTVNYLTSTAFNNPNYGISDQYEPANNKMATAQYISALDGTLTSGILSNASDLDWFQIEPNVEGGYKNLRIKLTNQPKNYTIELYNKDGRRLRSSKFQGTTDEVIVINNLPEGVYYIKVYSEDGDYSITPYKVSGLESELEYKSETP